MVLLLGSFEDRLMKKLWQNCHIATMQNGQYSYIEDAAIVTEGHLIHWIGKHNNFLPTLTPKQLT